MKSTMVAPKAQIDINKSPTDSASQCRGQRFAKQPDERPQPRLEGKMTSPDGYASSGSHGSSTAIEFLRDEV